MAYIEEMQLLCDSLPETERRKEKCSGSSLLAFQSPFGLPFGQIWLEARGQGSLRNTFSRVRVGSGAKGSEQVTTTVLITP